MTKAQYYKNCYQIERFCNQQRSFLYKFEIKFTTGLAALAVFYITLYFQWQPIMSSVSSSHLEIIMPLIPALLFVVMVWRNKNKYRQLKEHDSQLLHQND